MAFAASSSSSSSTPMLTPLQIPSTGCASSSPATLFFPRRQRTRAWLHYALLLLLLVVIGTIVVLSTANAYFGIHTSDLLTPADLALTSIKQPHQIPKIIHQTWKSSEIPERWKSVRETCSNLHSDWEYILWTDEMGRKLIIDEYPWFLDTFDGYRYPIQRADAIRYFVLHKHGGVYMDLDIGCKRPMDELLAFELILPQTVPVGVSNDLMFASKAHPFMDFVIHRLSRYDHDYLSNYPTVMFSTGPMALSSLLSTFRSSPLHASTSTLHILSPSLYGKNLPASSTHSNPFFTHYYGSCWHTPDAGFIVYLGKFGIFWLYAGIGVLALWCLRGLLRVLLGRSSLGSNSVKRNGRRGRVNYRSELLLLPVAWLDERKSRRNVIQGRCRCCGSSTTPSPSPPIPPPAYDSKLPQESDSEDSEVLFFSSTSVEGNHHHHQHDSNLLCSNTTTRRKDFINNSSNSTSPIQKAFYRLAELVGSPISIDDTHHYHLHQLPSTSSCSEQDHHGTTTSGLEYGNNGVEKAD